MRSLILILVAAISAPFAFAAPLSNLEARAASPYEFPYGSSDISIISTSHAERFIYGTHGFSLYTANFTVLFAVKNKMYEKEVGIRFSNDSWVTHSEAFATFTKPLNNGYELWTLNVDRGSLYNNDLYREHVIAGFVSYKQGPRSWDPANNYYIYQKATPQTPVYFLEDSVGYDAASNHIVLKGSVRTFSANRNVDYKKGSLVIRWTVDNWATSTDFTDATPSASDDTWSWKVPVAPAKIPLPGVAAYAIEYKHSASSSSFWLNNNSQNYQKRLNPLFDYYGDNDGIKGSTGVTGINQLGFTLVTDLALGAPRARLDSQGNYTENQLLIESQKLVNGPHSFEVRAAVAGGPDIFSITVPFKVENKIKFLEQWLPKLPAGHEDGLTAWSIAADGDKYYIGWDSGIVTRYSKFGDSAIEVQYSIGSPNRFEFIKSIGIQSGFVYALSSHSKLYRWTADGTIDTTFANSGVLLLDNSAVFNSKQVCYPADLKVLNDFIFIADSCSDRLLKFSSNGAFISELLMGTNVATLSSEGSSLIAAPYTYPNGYDYIVIDPVSFTVTSKLFLDGAYSVADVAVTGDKIAVAQDAALTYFDKATGKKLATWFGRGGGYTTPGSLYIAKGAVTLPDGSVTILSVEGPAVQRFSQDLLV
ncbi:hypothetical protein HDU67_008644 [Dinochytrium kinnereticum]|nr:hypothetical protein HDU67_008644 [Dinochytrium kinnereticum]